MSELKNTGRHRRVFSRQPQSRCPLLPIKPHYTNKTRQCWHALENPVSTGFKDDDQKVWYSGADPAQAADRSDY
jgi:hypothetical protein